MMIVGRDTGIYFNYKVEDEAERHVLHFIYDYTVAGYEGVKMTRSFVYDNKK